MTRKQLAELLRDYALQVETGTMNCPDEVLSGIEDTFELHTEKPISSKTAIKYVERMIGFGRSLFYQIIRPKLQGTKKPGELISFTKKELDEAISEHINKSQ